MYFHLIINAPDIAAARASISCAPLADCRDALAVLSAPGRHRERWCKLLKDRIAELEEEQAGLAFDRQNEEPDGE